MARKNRNVSLAQSGGIDHGFGTARGRGSLGKTVTDGKVEGHGVQGANSYAIRAEAGNNSRAPMKGRVGHPPPVHPGDSKQVTGLKKPKILPPFLRGSTNALKGKYR